MSAIWLVYVSALRAVAKTRTFTPLLLVALILCVLGVPGFAAAPPAPTKLAGTAGNAQVALSWTASSGATSYSIYCGTTAGGESTTAIKTGNTSTTYTNTGLTNGTKYYFTVKAVSSGGTSAASNEANATPELTAPTGVTATVSGTTIKIAWTAITSATSYSVYRGTTSDGESTTALGTSTTTSYTDSTPAAGTKYYYTVKAVMTASTSVASSEVNAIMPLNAPTGVSAAVSGSAIKIAWTASTNATSYSIYRGTTSGGESTTALGSATTASYTDSSTLTSGQTYYYTVKAVNSVSTSVASSEVNAKAPLTAPTGVTATVSGTSLKIAWAAVTNATSYSVYRGTASGGEGTSALGTATTTSYTDSSGSPGVKYYYTVVAAGAAGTSPASSEVNAVMPLLAPTGVVATAGAGQASLAWSASTNATSYSVYRGTTSGGESSTAIGSSTTAAYTDSSTSLSGGTKYYYTVKAVNSLTTSGASTEVSATPTLAAPTGLTAAPSNAKVVLAWTSVNSATSYVVQRSTTSGSGYTTLTTTSSKSYTDSSVTNGTTYYYVVAATNAAGQGPNSGQVTATPLAAPGAPTISATASPSQVALTWAAVPTAASYNVYRGTSQGGESSTAYKTGITTLGYTDSGLPNDGTQYFYEVKAVNVGGTSAYSNEVWGTPSLEAEDSPSGHIAQTSTGWIYGTSSAGGDFDDGTVWKFNPVTLATEIVHTFSARDENYDNADGQAPYGGVTLGTDGNIYGSTLGGGTSGWGTIFSVNTGDLFTSLYPFTGGSDGGNLFSTIVQSPAGLLYGTTTAGGASGNGTIFQATPGGQLTTLYAFSSTAGIGPNELTIGSDGNVYGTCDFGGGITNILNGQSTNDGDVFEFNVSTATYSDLHDWLDSDGSEPQTGVVQWSDGNFYGTTNLGGSGGQGTVYRMTPQGVVTVLHGFAGGTADGANPWANVVVLSDGTIFGTTSVGGTANLGTVCPLCL